MNKVFTRNGHINESTKPVISAAKDGYALYFMLYYALLLYHKFMVLLFDIMAHYFRLKQEEGCFFCVIIIFTSSNLF